MKYDLSNSLHRKQFIAKCNRLLIDKASCISIKDESTRTVRQNNYLHVLCRILALEVGESEYYAKQVYFKQLANPELFLREYVDKITGEVHTYIRSSAELNKNEMTIAINNLRRWAEEHKYYLPDADIDDNGTVLFKTKKDKEAFQQADIETERAGILIGIQE